MSTNILLSLSLSFAHPYSLLGVSWQLSRMRRSRLCSSSAKEPLSSPRGEDALSIKGAWRTKQGNALHLRQPQSDHYLSHRLCPNPRGQCSTKRFNINIKTACPPLKPRYSSYTRQLFTKYTRQGQAIDT
ncbi:hypothetical protein J3E74DRAFT_11798 [Bipolaris maydis]|nr:hypothetical protein J3E74DRAFT_11798 [Bipolaris maydis]